MEEPVKPLRKSKILVNRELTNYYKSVFKSCDKNDDGFVSILELKEFLEAQERSTIPDNVLECIIKKFDRNCDTQLDFEEFLEMVNNITFIETFQNATNRILRFILLPQKESAHPVLRKTVTRTGSYEKQFKFGFNTTGILIISILQVILFYSDSKCDEPGSIRRALYFLPCNRSTLYRYLSYLLVHLNQTHLWANVILQIIIGIPLEMVHSWRVIVIYLAGAVGGALLTSVFERSTIFLGGSGGDFALYTAHISVVLMNWREMSHPAVHLMIFAILVIMDIINVYIKMIRNVCYLCHVGGAVVGLLLGIDIIRNINLTKKENIMWYISCVTLCLFFFTLIILDCTLESYNCSDFGNKTYLMCNVTSDISNH
ncbi:rhomboid-related protein 3-like [Diorhabda sublineata]|uniref:rhomboid-related protein 3-like n=1 Tax=Diorhabda sublineata TaxID=1163346 RepID=UPI0024E08EB3|nr:rhomboid-related protein 3-like [Diorhabda sublineata]